MARKKPLIDRLTDTLLYISEKYELEKTDPPLHREIKSLLDEAAENTSRYWDDIPDWDDIDPEWRDGDGY